MASGGAGGAENAEREARRLAMKEFHRPRAAAAGLNVNKNFPPTYPFHIHQPQYSWGVYAMQQKARADPASKVPPNVSTFHAPGSLFKANTGFAPGTRPTSAMVGTLWQKGTGGSKSGGARVGGVIVQAITADAGGNEVWMIGPPGKAPIALPAATRGTDWEFYAYQKQATPASAAAAANAAQAAGEAALAAGADLPTAHRAAEVAAAAASVRSLSGRANKPPSRPNASVGVPPEAYAGATGALGGIAEGNENEEENNNNGAAAAPGGGAGARPTGARRSNRRNRRTQRRLNRRRLSRRRKRFNNI